MYTAVNEEELPQLFEAGLASWLECFSGCTALWGLVTEVRPDGSTYERHGIIFSLSASIQIPSGDNARHVARLRHAIDQIKLTLAVDPAVLMPLLFRHFMPFDGIVDLSTGRDVPFQLRFQLLINASSPYTLKHTLVTSLMENLDDHQVDVADPLRRYLVDRALRSASSRRLAFPVGTKFTVTLAEHGGCEAFFESVSVMVEALSGYQKQRATEWDVAGRHAPLNVEAIGLCLRVVPLGASVLKEASACVGKGIPVSVLNINLDIRTFDCEEEDLRSFLAAFTGDGRGIISVSRDLDPTQRPIDTTDIGDKILMLLRCIGDLPGGFLLDLTGLFALCRRRVNRQAILRGLVESILFRESSISLQFNDDAHFDADDADYFLQEVERWRRENPGRKSRLESLDFDAPEGSVEFVSEFVRSLDDVEDALLSLRMDDTIDDEDLRCMLSYPSLHSLSITNIDIETMDIFTSSTAGSPELQLKRLELNGLTLQDSSSMVSFVKSLDPRSAKATRLAHTLQCLSVVETDNRGDDDEVDEVRLAISDRAAVTALDELLIGNKILRKVNFVGDFANIPVLATTDYPARISYIPAPPITRRDALTMAQKAAFLSGVLDGNSAAASAFDSNIMRLILAFNYYQDTSVKREIYV